ncbi:putative ribonuclease H-like domain-containing protein [Tanacetum coccineum]
MFIEATWLLDYPIIAYEQGICLLAWMGWNADIEGRGFDELCTYDEICFDNSFISDKANRYGARATDAAPGIKSIWDSTGQAGGRECQYDDAQSMFTAIKTRFGGNEATKKTQKALLKQQYENFNASSTESLDSLFNRLQKLVSRLAILESVGTSFGSLCLTPSTSSTNNVNTVASEVSTSSTNVNTASSSVSTANISDNVMYAFMVENPNGSNILQHDLEQIHEDDLEAMDLKWQLSFLLDVIGGEEKRGQETLSKDRKEDHSLNPNDTDWNTRRSVNEEDTSLKAMLAIDGVGFDWSDMVEEQVLTNMDLMAFLKISVVYTDNRLHKLVAKNYETLKKQCDDLIVKLNETEFKAATYKRGLATIEDRLVTYKKNEVLFSEENCWSVREDTGVKSLPLFVTKMSDNYEGMPQMNDKGFVDSGCSRHMTGNIAYLLDSKEFDRGYVTFGGGAYGGRITGKGILQTDNLDFDDWPDESHILLKILREDNMYSFDLKNIVPNENLTCLVAKATSDESMLWHRRLGHINFKNINKLVKENLDRGLPLKRL